MSRIQAFRALLLLSGSALLASHCSTMTMEPWRTTHPPARQPVDVIPPNDLQLSLTLSRRVFELGEPVYVLLTARNVGTEPLRIFPRLSVEAPATWLEVSPPGVAEEVFRFLPLMLVDTNPPLQELAPGETLGTVFPAYFGGRGWTFPEVGTYRLRVVYDRDRRKTASPFVDLVIRANESQAGEHLMAATEASWEAGKFMTWQGGDHLTQGLALLEGVRGAHPNTVLESYMNYFLGHRLAWYGGVPRRGPDTALALSHLGAARDADLPVLLQIWKGIDQARCHLLLRDRGAAQPILDAARVLAVTHPAYEGLLAEIDRLRAITP